MNTFIQGKKYLVFLIIATVLALAINIFIVVQSCLNANQSTESSGLVVNLFKAIINTFSKDAINDGNIDTFTHVIRKLVGHFGLYACSGLLTSWALYMWIEPLDWFKPYIYLIIDLSFGFLFSLLTEIIQLFTPGRSGEFTDSLIDFSGYLLGTLIILLILFFLFEQRNKKAQQ